MKLHGRQEAGTEQEGAQGTMATCPGAGLSYASESPGPHYRSPRWVPVPASWVQPR